MCLIEPKSLPLGVKMFVFLETKWSCYFSLRERRQSSDGAVGFQCFCIAWPRIPGLESRYALRKQLRPIGKHSCSYVPPVSHPLGFCQCWSAPSWLLVQPEWRSPNAWCGSTMGPQHLGTTKKYLWWLPSTSLGCLAQPGNSVVTSRNRGKKIVEYWRFTCFNPQVNHSYVTIPKLGKKKPTAEGISLRLWKEMWANMLMIYTKAPRKHSVNSDCHNHGMYSDGAILFSKNSVEVKLVISPHSALFLSWALWTWQALTLSEPISSSGKWE